MINNQDGFDLHLKWHFPDAKKYAFTFIILFVSLIIIYGNSFHCEFHFDDFPNIVNNPNVHLKSLTWENIKKTFYGVNDAETKILRPLSYFTLALNYYFGKTNVFGYHLVNFIIHYIASLFLFLFIYNTLKLPLLKSKYEQTAYPIALLSAFLWATHPIQVTAVTYIVQRMASMAGMFYIMAMYFYLKARMAVSRNQKPEARSHFILCGISAMLSFASKQNTALLPVSLFLYDVFLIQGITWENVKKNLRLMLYPVLICLILASFYRDFLSLFDAYDDRPFTLAERLLTQPRIILFYISLMIYPIDSRMTFLYDVDISKSFFIPWTTLPAILAILFSIGIALGLCRKKPFIAYCILFFFINHLIESSILPLELIYEHRNYIPSMLFLVLPVILMLKIIDYFSYQKNIQFLFVFVFTFVLSAQAHTVYSRNYIFRYDLTFWQDNVEKSPDLSRVHNNLGKVYMDNGLHSKAFGEFKNAIQLEDDKALYHENMGIYYLEVKNYEQALEQFIISNKTYNKYPYHRTLYGFAMTYYKLNNLVEAKNFIEKAILFSPFKEEYHMLLGLILLKSDDVDGAIRSARKSLEIQPEYDLPLMILGESFKRKGEYEKAIHYWEDFLEKYPHYIRGHMALIELLSIMGKDAKLNMLIGRLMFLKKEKSYIQMIHEENEKNDIGVYTPSPNTLLPILRKNFLQQATSLNLYPT